MSRVIAVVALVVSVALGGCGDEREPTAPATDAPAAEAEGAHIHGLGVDPADRSLVIATHAGLFRAGDGQPRAQRVGSNAQDTMGFTVVGPNRFLGSGHPDIEGLNEGKPPHLGLIESRDAGERWRTISLSGAADFHVLRAAGPRVYGFNSQDGRLMVSSDRGRSWTRRTPPGPLLDLAMQPRRSGAIVAATEDGLYASPDSGSGWRPLASGLTGLLAWPATDRLVLVSPSGSVHLSGDGGRSWAEVGNIGGQPAALASDGRDLYVALHTNEVKVSRDGGRGWQPRAALGA